MDDYRNKILGMMQLSTVPLQFSQADGCVHVHSHEELLGEFSLDEFNEFTAHKILDILGVEKHGK